MRRARRPIAMSMPPFGKLTQIQVGGSFPGSAWTLSDDLDNSVNDLLLWNCAVVDSQADQRAVVKAAEWREYI